MNDLQQKLTVRWKLIWNKNQNNKHGRWITSRTRKGALAFPAGCSEATHRPSPSVSWAPYGSAVSPSPNNFPEKTPLSDTLKVYQKLSHRILLSVNIPHPWTLSASKNYPHLHPTILPGRPGTAKNAGCNLALACLLPRMLGKATANTQTFRALAEGRRARGALTAGWWRFARWPRWQRSRGSCRGH